MESNPIKKTAAALALASAVFGGVVAYAAAQDDTATAEPQVVEPGRSTTTATPSTTTPEATTPDSTESGDATGRGGRGGPGGDGMRGGGMRGGAEIADLLGITTDELRTALGEGQSLAEVAEANGVDVDVVIDAIVAKYNERIDAAVADGHLTEAEATTLRSQVVDHVTAEVNGEQAAPLEGLGHGRGGPGGDGMRGGGMRGGAEIADLLGITTDELRTALSEGQSLADVAEANGVDPDVVIDAIVDKLNAHIDEEVAEGDLTEAEAATLRDQVVDHVTAKVNGEEVTPLEGLGPDGGRGHGRGGDMPGTADANDASGDTDAATTPSSSQTEDA